MIELALIDLNHCIVYVCVYVFVHTYMAIHLLLINLTLMWIGDRPQNSTILIRN